MTASGMLGALRRYLMTPSLLVLAGLYGGDKFGAPAPIIDAVDRGLDLAGGAVTLARKQTPVDAPSPEAAAARETIEDALAPPAPPSNHRALNAAASAAAPPDLQSADATPGAGPFAGANAGDKIADNAAGNNAGPPSLSAPGVKPCAMEISNPPPIDSLGLVTHRDGAVAINGVDLLLAPVTAGCLSSGYGLRAFGVHRGVDYYAESGAVIAAADGVIAEATFRDDYGNMVLIDHGDGVFTRYAHLARFADGVIEGAAVRRGQQLGPIGATGRAHAPHLHYEIRVGDYGNPKASWGLATLDPFDPAVRL